MNFIFSFADDVLKKIPDEIYSSLVVFLIILILSIVIRIKAAHADPLAKPKGILLLAEMAVEKCDQFVSDNMGKVFVKKISPYVGFCFMYVFMAFTISLFGFSSPMTYYIVPFSLALGTFILIHATSVYYTRWKYFQRFVSPFPIFLPINLISMWAPLISLSFRLFGNACAGWVLMELIYGVFQMISEAIFGGAFLPIAAIVTPALHAYFDVFSGFIQTMIFAYLTMLLIASEVPEEIDVNAMKIE